MHVDINDGNVVDAILTFILLSWDSIEICAF